MQIKYSDGTMEERDGLSLAEVLEGTRKAFADPDVVEVTSYPRYLVKHEGPNRRARRDMKFGRPNELGWREKDY